MMFEVSLNHIRFEVPTRKQLIALQVVNVIEKNGAKPAIKVSTLPEDPREIAAIARVLSNKQSSPHVLLDADPYFPNEVGAIKCVLLVFDEVPEGDFGIGGVYGVVNWVHDYLEDAMPKGYGVAHSKPVMRPLIGDKTGTKFRIVEPLEQQQAEKAGLPVAYCTEIAPLAIPVR